MTKNIDEVIENFKNEASKATSKHRQYWSNNKDLDDLYNVDIHIFRRTGMGNSIHTIIGNKISILTATCSFLTSLINENVATIDDITDMIKLIERSVNNDK